ncbi:hypothetical protein BZG36_01030 [Bifiguratus adelaidae]|uniref:Uncharacterized protein n=1 Tax=Bifiguratus adelaidae TaxID=1938954 RepID=A0A261Y6A3_9FUNG|nr:hypothetical protein BZG36_01030 [Bifiguratus adelaidae]
MQPEKEEEATVYVRGFMTDRERVEDFALWTRSHSMLVQSPKHRWGPLALGYNWRSGQPRLNYVVPWAPIYWITTRLPAGIVIPSPSLLATFFLADLSMHLVKLTYQYHKANFRSSEYASELSNVLRTLRQKHPKLRVISHSLGCHHVLKALQLMDLSERPDVVHLLAPAVKESEFDGILHRGIAREKTFLYYTRRDITLYILFRYVLAGWTKLGYGEPAMGEVGVKHKSSNHYSNLVEIDTAPFFGRNVHTGYAAKFGNMAQVDFDAVERGKLDFPSF